MQHLIILTMLLNTLQKSFHQPLALAPANNWAVEVALRQLSTDDVVSENISFGHARMPIRKLRQLIQEERLAQLQQPHGQLQR